VRKARIDGARNQSTGSMLFDPGEARNGPSGAGARPVYRPVSDAGGGCAIIRGCNNAR
jgi:hypothetical protein